ncbi:MAG: hypothetical protein ACLRXQ_08660 [Phascolarctobacterium faecium]
MIARFENYQQQKHFFYNYKPGSAAKADAVAAEIHFETTVSEFSSFICTISIPFCKPMIFFEDYLSNPAS